MPTTTHLWPAVAIAIAIAAFQPAEAATFADAKFSEIVVATNLNPTAMAIAPDSRIFVCSKSGALRVVKNGALLAKPFVTLPVITASEQGLIGVTCHPNFPESAFVYVYYTLTGPEHNRISRFRVDGDTALGGLGGEKIIFDLDPTTAANHNGGAIHFGNDGKLYASIGNSASSANSLSMTTTLGKILRLNPDGSIPTDNPFVGQTTGKAQAIWCAGMRNTFTFDVDKVSGRIFGAEVGDGWEEVNELQAGSNYGYGRQEGYTVPTNTTGIVGTFRPAIYAYNTGGCIIAAAFYPGPGVRNFPADFQRKFFFADHNNGYIKIMDMENPKTVVDFATAAQNPVDIKFSADGTLYYLNRGQTGGSLLKVTYAGGPVGMRAASADRRHAAGWRLALAQNGRLVDPGSHTPALVLDAQGKAVANTLLRPGSTPQGIYYVKDR